MLLTVLIDAPELARTRWQFWYDSRDHRLVLDRFAEEIRPTPRHQFRSVRSYYRLSHERRNSDVADILLEAPVIPDEVRRQAEDEFVDTLRVVSK